jgi:hypothetical protein
MFRAAYGQGRSGAQRAPVENAEEEDSRKAKKRQTLFFAFISPYDLIRICRALSLTPFSLAA